MVVLGFGTLGILHFVRKRDFEAIVPEYVPMSAEDAVRWSGYAELIGAAGVAIPATRPLARWWLLGLLAAVYPANIEMAVAPERCAERGVPADRIVLIAWGPEVLQRVRVPRSVVVRVGARALQPVP
jgi:uncharacterized membrane protein